MPSLMICPGCGEKCWNRTPTAFSLIQSLHVLRSDATCPVCDKVMNDLITDPKPEPPSRHQGAGNPLSYEQIEFMTSRAKVHSDMQRDMQVSHHSQYLRRSRLAHYEFAHLLLRNYVFGPIDAPRALLNRASAKTVVESLVRIGKEGLAKYRVPYDFGADDIETHAFEIDVYPQQYSLAIVKMPEAKEPAEAHQVGILVREGEADEAGPRLQYFTLEKTRASGPYPKTCLCEWLPDGKRRNYGHGPRGENVDDFIAYIRRVIDNKLWEWI